MCVDCMNEWPPRSQCSPFFWMRDGVMRLLLGGGYSSGSCLLTNGPREAQAIPLCKKPAYYQKGPAGAVTSSLWVESVQQGAE